MSEVKESSYWVNENDDMRGVLHIAEMEGEAIESGGQVIVYHDGKKVFCSSVPDFVKKHRKAFLGGDEG
ncbi:hypothetical protein [Candidatus Tokpelaia sp.]|uniref:hypothetical protein n=1 Tax=Candidatus Tokpelaia sp. TaxID=2233777 RepID=UPI001238B942|nr:hypothetical protein [Candidatus Tokpelaia sp.]KAA6405050.1 hypothetical protein DPQ22_05655 [Candidatus Tokpelaia sp.]